MSEYVTKQGDMWDTIAKEQLSSEKYAGILIKNNPEYRDVYIFSEGIRLKIPKVNVSDVSEGPPWKKVY